MRVECEKTPCIKTAPDNFETTLRPVFSAAVEDPEATAVEDRGAASATTTVNGATKVDSANLSLRHLQGAASIGNGADRAQNVNDVRRSGGSIDGAPEATVTLSTGSLAPQPPSVERLKS